MTNPNDPIHGTSEIIEFNSGLALAKNGGLTKREEFAKAAMQGIIASGNLKDFVPRNVAVNALGYADALIAALNKASEGRDGG